MNKLMRTITLLLLGVLLAACGAGGASEPAADGPALPTATLTAVPTATAPANSLVLTRRDGDSCTTTILQPEGGLQTGRCAGQLAAYAYSADTPDAQAVLADFLASYAPFQAETPVGTVRLNSTGTTPATPAMQRRIAETANWLAETAVAGRSSAAGFVALSWHREGGIAGFCDDLAISWSGQAEATSCKGTAVTSTLDDSQLSQLYSWLDTLQPFDVTESDPAGAADAMQTTLRFNGRGTSPASADEQQAVLAFAAAHAGQQTGAQSQSPATSVVDAFLAALQTDPSGHDSLGYLSSDLQAEVAAGKSVAALMGLQNLIPTYTLAQSTSDNAADQAVVAATLNYGSPTVLNFHVTQENGAWLISRIDAGGAISFQPPAGQECSDLRAAVSSALGAEATLSTADFTDIVSDQTGTGCLVAIQGTGETLGSFLDVAQKLQAALVAQGWTPDMAYLADGPTSTAIGLRRANNLALLNVGWQPSAAANCSTDLPITACEVTPAQQEFTITLHVAAATSG